MECTASAPLLQGGDTCAELFSSHRWRPEGVGGGRTTTRVSVADRKPLSQVCSQAAFLPSWQLELAQQSAGVFVFFPQQPAPPPTLTPGLGS